MISFQEARAVVARQLGPTLAEGYEDERAYAVALQDPPVDDLVNLVDKNTGELDRVYFFNEVRRLQAMTPVSDEA